MDSKKIKRKCRSDLETSNIAYWMIRLMHENPIMPLIRNPNKLLKATGLREGQQVLEVGCGPGLFTISAAKIVGEGGHVYAVDINPRMIARVKEKIEKQEIKNVTAVCANTSNTDLPDESIDLVFLFGLPYIVGGLDKVICELHRVLRTEGSLSFEKTKCSKTKLIDEVERGGFIYTGKQGRIFLFRKKGGKNHEQNYEKVIPENRGYSIGHWNLQQIFPGQDWRADERWYPGIVGGRSQGHSGRQRRGCPFAVQNAR